MKESHPNYGQPITDIERTKAVMELWGLMFEYPMQFSIEAAKLGGEIGEEHQKRLEYFWKLVAATIESPKKP